MGGRASRWWLWKEYQQRLGSPDTMMELQNIAQRIAHSDHSQPQLCQPRLVCDEAKLGPRFGFIREDKLGPRFGIDPPQLRQDVVSRRPRQVMAVAAQAHRSSIGSRNPPIPDYERPPYSSRHGLRNLEQISRLLGIGRIAMKIDGLRERNGNPNPAPRAHVVLRIRVPECQENHCSNYIKYVCS
ncbi:hypothetical protein CRV24_004198 [Beauveria bassiana]|nr:hypothetical protein CRV24_004198 [Beauveria bassiana]